jgi:hypothetical protein
MHAPYKRLLFIDAVINLLLGSLLLLYPLGIADWLGVPVAASAFYPTILGGVLIGIGLALLIEARGGMRGARGLGMAGAIAINLCGAGVLAVWLVAMPPAIPLRGMILLGAIAVAVLGLALIELFTGFGRH